MKRNRRVFFVDVWYELDCIAPDGLTSVVVASRRQAKKVITYVRTRCYEFHGARIQSARQRDLLWTGWFVNRRYKPPSLHEGN